MKIIEEAAAAVAKATGCSKESALSATQLSEKFGDVSSTIAFEIARQQKRNPAEIAREIAGKIKPPKSFVKVEAAGPYINFYFSDLFYASLVKEIIKKKEKFGRFKKTKRKIMVEYFDANTHKGIHIGHIRNVSLGEALCRILEFVGEDVIRVNYQGDIGPHVAKCLWGFINLYGAKEPDVEKKGVWLGKVYAEASAKITANPDLENEAMDINLKLYSEDEKISGLWKTTRQWCLDDFNKFYDEFGVRFDEFFFESQTEKIGKEMVVELLSKGIAKKDEGAVIVDLRAENLGVCVLLTKEGYPLYPTKDLGLAKLKFEKYDPAESIHVVGKEQEFYFRQLFKVFEKAGMKKAAEASYHLIYELVMLPEGKMSSREGTVVLYEELRDKLFSKTLEEVNNRHPDWSENKKSEIAKKIALAALKFQMVRRENNRVLLFDWEKALSLEGDSGPYLQYAYVRTKGILRKAVRRSNMSRTYILNSDEKKLLRKLVTFEEAAAKAASSLSPHVLCDYLLDLAAELNRFYSVCRVLNADKDEEKEARLAIILSVNIILGTALRLIGMETLEEM